MYLDVPLLNALQHSGQLKSSDFIWKMSLFRSSRGYKEVLQLIVKRPGTCYSGEVRRLTTQLAYISSKKPNFCIFNGDLYRVWVHHYFLTDFWVETNSF